MTSTSIAVLVTSTTTTTTLTETELDAAAAPPNMAARIDAEIDANPLGHQWVSQSTISIDAKTAKRAAFRGSFRSEAGMRIDALEVMCHVCRRMYDAVSALDAEEIERCAVINDGLPEGAQRARPNLNCPGQIDNTHLIGGDLSVRAKRIIYTPVGTIQHHVIDRRGMSGYSVHAGK